MFLKLNLAQQAAQLCFTSQAELFVLNLLSFSPVHVFFCCPLQGCLISETVPGRNELSQAELGAQGCAQADGTTDPGSAVSSSCGRLSFVQERQENQKQLECPQHRWGPAPDLGKTFRVKSGISPSCWEQGHQGDSDPPTVTPAQTLMSSRLQSLP